MKTIDQVRQDATSTSEFAAPLAAGTYLVGDPCYAFSNETARTAGRDLWMEWLNDAWKDVDANTVRILDGRVNGMRIVASGTAHGDGEYQDQEGRSYPVDAGLLGAVHVGFVRNLYPELAHLPIEEFASQASMSVVEFEVPFHVSYDEEEGTVRIGHVSINTDDWGFDEDEDEDDPWGDDEDEE